MADHSSHPRSEMDLTDVVASSQIIYDRYGRPYRVIPLQSPDPHIGTTGNQFYPTPTSAPHMPRAHTVPALPSQDFVPPGNHAMPGVLPFPTFSSTVSSISPLTSLNSNLNNTMDREFFASSRIPYSVPYLPPAPAPTPATGYYNSIDGLSAVKYSDLHLLRSPQQSQHPTHSPVQSVHHSPVHNVHNSPISRHTHITSPHHHPMVDNRHGMASPTGQFAGRMASPQIRAHIPIQHP
ncbi:hypothetical protein F5878DRAFT_666674 [Lentinula raphanica]|uniref:Uncharacterized protein n=1 Tax=Lentinula raphanica TaxID=153919 RepID=A0AA38NXL3_9AGAR|nr:hypothetical protein F5878DRAFT_666674 [Lentinula raphanica]